MIAAVLETIRILHKKQGWPPKINDTFQTHIRNDQNLTHSSTSMFIVTAVQGRKNENFKPT